ncbi:MAG TPA: hypothetical protein VK612_10730 [Pyrinomonadaceae bacterium]|nr:hypothetical protein [Pyrinomonadaceae bacterium]
MNQPKKLASIVFIAAVIVFGGRVSFSQNDSKAAAEPNYEAMLYVILGSDDTTQRGELPKGLTAVSRQLHDNFSYQNYKLVNTYIGRVANTGSLEYKSVSNIFGAEQTGDVPSFLEWTVSGVRSGQAAGGAESVQIQAFRFGARVPIKLTYIRDESGKQSSSINYESVGLTVNRTGIAGNTPTLIGNIALPKTTGTVFLVLTVRPV